MTSFERRPEDSRRLCTFFAELEPYRAPGRCYADVSVRSKTRNGMADRATMVAHELLENAVKYGDPTADVELQVHVADLG